MRLKMTCKVCINKIIALISGITVLHTLAVPQ